MPVSKPRGPAPKPESQRRRRNKPESQGEADVVPGVAAAGRPDELGFEAHPMVEALWDALGDSVEGKFYSAADWQRVRMELWFGQQLLSSGKTPGAQAWSVFQAGLAELLVSPADKRRAGIEMKPPVVDPDAEAAVAQLDEYRSRLQSG